jgi:hypothetical protein
LGTQVDEPFRVNEDDGALPSYRLRIVGRLVGRSGLEPPTSALVRAEHCV